MERITDIVDANGKIIGVSGLDEAHAKGLLHRSVHVLVVNDAGEIFIRRRPSNKPIYPDLWTSSVGTHVLHGMSPDRVAQSALKDFLGIDARVQLVGEALVQDEFENEVISVYICKADTVTDLNPQESSEGAFMPIERIKQLGETHTTTPHLLGALAVYRNSLQGLSAS